MISFLTVGTTEIFPLPTLSPIKCQVYTFISACIIAFKIASSFCVKYQALFCSIRKYRDSIKRRETRIRSKPPTIRTTCVFHIFKFFHGCSGSNWYLWKQVSPFASCIKSARPIKHLVGYLYPTR